MAASARFTLHRHERVRRPPFVLTPLIDVMFLLLIFFMLSSQISPYSLLPLGPVAAGSDAAAAPAAAAPPAVSDLSVRVSAGFASIGGESVELSALTPAIERFVGQGVTGFLVVATRSASVQDVVTVLESLQAASAERVTLVNAGGGAGGRTP